jgi:hypothetical protein
VLVKQPKQKNRLNGHGHISQIVRRSTFDSSADRYSRKTSRFTSWHSFIAFSVQDWRKKDVSRYESKTLRRSKSTMGNAKTYRRQQSTANERRTHTSGTKETFPTNESSVGSKKKSCCRQKITYDLGPMKVYRPAVDLPPTVTWLLGRSRTLLFEVRQCARASQSRCLLKV